VPHRAEAAPPREVKAMKKALLIPPLLILISGWSVCGQQSQGEWEPFKELKEQKRRELAGQQAPQPLSNDSIVKLVKAGLSEETIISMVNTQPGSYSLGVDDIIALKKAGVSEKVIAAMLDKSASAPTPVPLAPERVPEGEGQPSQAATIPPVPAGAVSEVGVYYKKGDAWVQVMPEAVNWQTGGVLKGAASGAPLGVIGAVAGAAGGAIIKSDVNGRLLGPHGRISIAQPAEFLFRLPEGVEITEYQLLRLRTHRDAREFRSVTGGVFHRSGGAKRDTVPFEYKKTATRTYTVSLTDLRAGEYGFLSPGAAFSSHASAQLGKMYTFQVVE
jgi:hypothetical protein